MKAMRPLWLLGIAILFLMWAIALLLVQSEPSVSSIQSLVDAKNVEGLTRLIQPLPKSEINPFQVLRTGGAYGTGRYGWKAYALTSPANERFVVIGTALTSQDVGEILLKREGTKLRYVPETDAMGITIHRHDFDLDFELDKKKAILVDKMTFSSKAGTSPFVFRMSPAFKVSKIVSGAKPVKFTQASGVVFAERPQGKATYTISYTAIVDLPDYAGSISPKIATLTNDYWYPMIARQPAPYSLQVTTPQMLVSVGQGEERVTTKSGGVTQNFTMDLPVVFYSITTAPFKKFSKTIDGKEFWIQSTRMSEERMSLQPDLYAPIVDFYEKSFGKLPFSGYGALDSEVYGGGALEAYSYATYGGGLPSEDAHEPAHTWWGGILNNTYLGSFWNESFAVYSDGLYHRNSSVGNKDERAKAFISNGNPSPDYNERPIEGSGAFAGPVGSSLGYGKGAKVLQMLEQVLGTEKMIAAMAEWIRADHGKAVDWADFERVVTRLHPDPFVKSFFDDWLRRPGYARLKADDLVYSGGKASFRIRSEAGPHYSMPLDVMVQYPDGSREFHTIRLAKGVDQYSVPARQTPALVSLDPWLRALRPINENEYPVEAQRNVFRFKRYTDPARKDWLPNVGRTSLTELPNDLDGVFIVGHPSTTPQMKALCDRVGFRVVGDKLTYDGTTIDLNDGAAIAIVPLDRGSCAIGLGKTKLFPGLGRAHVGLVDGLGRFLRGKTNPKTAGDLVLKP